MAAATGHGNSELVRGWPLILAALVGTGCGVSAIPIFTLGVFTKPLAEAFGWSRAEIQGLLSCLVIGVLIGAPAMGALMDRHGVRTVTVVSTLGFAICLVLMGVGTQSLISFYAVGIFSGVIGAGTTAVTWSRAIIAKFHATRGLALGLALTGSGVCAAVGPLYATWLVEAFGWRAAYVGLALLPALVATPMTIVALRLPRDAGRKTGPTDTDSSAMGPTWGLTLREAVRGYAFWGIGLGMFLAGLGTSGIVPHLIPMLSDRGVAPMDAARIAGSLGVAVIAGRIVSGYLVDHLWPPGVAAVILGIPALASVVLAAEDSSMAVTTAAAMAVGFAGGAEFDLLAFLTARYLGTRQYGLIYGCMYALFILSTGFAPVAFGLVFDSQGNYAAGLYAVAGCFVASAAMMLTLGRAPAGGLARAGT